MNLQYIEAAITLTFRDLKVRYEKSLLGFTWTVLNPLATFLIYYFVFAKIVKIKMKDYWVFLLSGLLIWQFISSSINSSTNCIGSNKSIIKKMAIRSDIFLISSVASRLLEFFLETLVGIIIFISFGRNYSFYNLFSLFVSIALTYIFVLSISMMVSALSVYIPDFSYGVQIGLKLLFFMCPIFYGKHSVPAKYMKLYNLNPLNPFIENYRNVLYLGKSVSFKEIFIMTIISFSFFIVSYILFKKLEKYFAEII